MQPQQPVGPDGRPIMAVAPVFEVRASCQNPACDVGAVVIEAGSPVLPLQAPQATCPVCRHYMKVESQFRRRTGSHAEEM